MINWNLWIWVFLSRNGRFVTHICFQKNLLKPLFLLCFWVRAFWAKLSKKGHFGHPPKNEKMTDSWKAHFWYFLRFVLFCFFFFVFFLFLCFFGGFKGQVRWPEGPPHLTLNPPYLFWFCFYLVFFFWFFGGFKGQVRWPEGPPHLGPKPPFLLVFLFFFFAFFFPFFAF